MSFAEARQERGADVSWPERIEPADSSRLVRFSFSLVGLAGFEPATRRLCFPPQLSLPLSGSWSGLSLHPILNGGLPSSLYTFPLARAWLGITMSADLGFPEFDRSTPENYSSGCPVKEFVMIEFLLQAGCSAIEL
jgi:hypothetical protein